MKESGPGDEASPCFVSVAIYRVLNMLIEFQAGGWEGRTGSDRLRKGEDPEGRFTLSRMEQSLLQQPTQEKGLAAVHSGNVEDLCPPGLSFSWSQATRAAAEGGVIVWGRLLTGTWAPGAAV